MAALLMPDLDAFLSEAGARPWRWGEADCTMFAADWVRLVTGLDPAERCRGRYATELQARRLMRRGGGFVGLIGAEMERLGFRRTHDPQTGDVGLIQVPISMAQDMPVVGTVAGIRSGAWWIARGLDAVRGGAFPTVAAWAVGR